MEKLNLWELDDEDIEFFCDTINENTVSAGELLAANEKKDFGNHCTIEAVSHEVLSANKDDETQTEKIRSHFLLHMQAETGIKIEVVWEHFIWDDMEDEFGFEEVYFESKEGPFDEDGPNLDPRNSPYWEEFLDDFEG